jgi:hypothetical protein
MRSAALLSILLLTACSGPSEPTQVRLPRSPATAEISHKTHSLPSGTLTVVQIPVFALGSIGTEFQTCFLYRDNSLPSIAMQCPNDRSSYSIDPP